MQFIAMCLYLCIDAQDTVANKLDDTYFFDIESTEPQIAHYKKHAGSILVHQINLDSMNYGASYDSRGVNKKRLVAYNLDPMLPPYSDVIDRLQVSFEEQMVDSDSVKGTMNSPGDDDDDDDDDDGVETGKLENMDEQEEGEEEPVSNGDGGKEDEDEILEENETINDIVDEDNSSNTYIESYESKGSDDKEGFADGTPSRDSATKILENSTFDNEATEVGIDNKEQHILQSDEQDESKPIGETIVSQSTEYDIGNDDVNENKTQIDNVEVFNPGEDDFVVADKNEETQNDAIVLEEARNEFEQEEAKKIDAEEQRIGKSADAANIDSEVDDDDDDDDGKIIVESFEGSGSFNENVVEENDSKEEKIDTYNIVDDEFAKEDLLVDDQTENKRTLHTISSDVENQNSTHPDTVDQKSMGELEADDIQNKPIDMEQSISNVVSKSDNSVSLHEDNHTTREGMEAQTKLGKEDEVTTSDSMGQVNIDHLSPKEGKGEEDKERNEAESGEIKEEDSAYDDVEELDIGRLTQEELESTSDETTGEIEQNELDQVPIEQLSRQIQNEDQIENQAKDEAEQLTELLNDDVISSEDKLQDESIQDNEDEELSNTSDEVYVGSLGENIQNIGNEFDTTDEIVLTTLTKNEEDEPNPSIPDQEDAVVVGAESNSVQEDEDDISFKEQYTDDAEAIPENGSSSSANTDFVKGLDDIHKFFEDVDPPDELDPGAGGQSLEEVLKSQGIQIIKTRMNKSIQSIKEGVVKIRTKFDKHFGDKEGLQAFTRLCADLKERFIDIKDGCVESVRDFLEQFTGNDDFESLYEENAEDEKLAEMRRKLME